MDKKEKMERKKIEREKKIVKRSGGLLNFLANEKTYAKGDIFILKRIIKSDQMKFTSAVYDIKLYFDF